MQLFKYQMITKFSAIDNSTARQKQYSELRGEIYLITSPDHVWDKWERVFEAHEEGELIDPDTGHFYRENPRYKPLKPLMREFFRQLQGLTETEMGKVADHILHTRPTAKRAWVHPKIVFSTPKTFVPSCYQLKEWAPKRKHKTTIVQELHKIVPDKRIFEDGAINHARWRAFKKEFNFTSASMAALIKEAGEVFLKARQVKGGKNLALPDRTLKVFKNFINEKQIVNFEGDAQFNPVHVKDPVKIQGWPGLEARKAIRVKAGDRFPFALMDFRNIPGHTIGGSIDAPFYEFFMPKFIEYGCPRFREVDIWLWIVEDVKAEQLYELVKRLQPDYAVSKSHYNPAPAEGCYASCFNKKTKQCSTVCLYFVFKAAFLNDASHPLHRMEKLFKVPDGLGNSPSLYDESKYAMYPSDELRMGFYIDIMKKLTSRGDTVFNVFGGTKPMFAGMVSVLYTLKRKVL